VSLKLKILFVGVVDIFWSDHIPMVRALKLLGHNLYIFNLRTIALQMMLINEMNLLYKLFRRVSTKLNFSYRQNPDDDSSMTIYETYKTQKKTLLSRILKPLIRFNMYYGRKRMVHSLINLVRKGKFDLVFLANTKLLSPYIIKKINKFSKTWYFYVEPISDIANHNAINIAKSANWASAACLDVHWAFIKAGVNCIHLREGVDDTIYYPKKEKKKIDVCFIGGKSKEREIYVKFLKKNGINIKCFGFGWEGAPTFTEEAANIYRRAKIVLNFIRAGITFSIRVFQAMGTGSFLLSQCSEELKKTFIVNEHLDCFKTKKELLAKVQYYLENPNERERIAKNGSEFVHKNYTIDITMKKIMHIVNKI